MTNQSNNTKSIDDLNAEITRLNKIIESLMNRAERNASIHGSDFNLFQTAITLEEEVQKRTKQLEAALQENEKITRTLRETETNLRLLIENAPVSIHEIDMEGRIISMSKAGLDIRGVNKESEILGTPYLNGVSSDDQERISQLLAKAYEGKTTHFEYNANTKASKVMKSCFVPIRENDSQVKKIMGITEDITERKKTEELIHELAFYDPLTKLPNRRLLHDRLKQAMAASCRSGLYGAVMFLDLDNFKPLNDRYGHDTGDLLLIEVANRITDCLRRVDTVARIGGDEFVVMLGELKSDMELSIIHADIVAEKIRVTLDKPYHLKKVDTDNRETVVEHHCSASIGVMLFIDHQIPEEEILKLADKAMYQAKESGRNTVVFHDPITE